MDVLNTLKHHDNTMKNKFGAKKVGVFGSFVRGEELDNSDIDILVEFEKGQKTFDNYMELKFYLEDLFDRKVDLVVISSIKPQLKDNILDEAVYV
ncbi:DNA polymerase beta domain protein region [Methanohalobium evestigatum Z-7303]|uniref:protein adenylyltransferase n=1 Tax=Methanohalobium evestigatum (strain ATCC BAA-1072 / DSM 3721 / NBRC 107634 / OCM 161 / Z-7303) TaxID=644295 RepID=D7E7J9_METEZ|nr:nucleotidyltransferase family protein [Methanohalobium evestigatum]ADI74072.1 DNA polymerase beta domain protein region [Methanohalobium evestigatum Z-7303]